MKSLPELFENNRTWAERVEQEHPGFFSELAKGQNPQILWIGCSDSRVPANQVVDLPPGSLFVHRNVANVVVHSDLNCQSVLQYSVEVLKVKHIVVSGHYGCGGVTAALKGQSFGLIDNWLSHIQDVIVQHEGELSSISDEQKRVNRMCELNVRAQVINVCRSPFVQQAWEKGQTLSVHGWIYDLKDGLLSDLDVTVGGKKDLQNIL
ncbi:carbonate dehydratase [Halalkalibaculum sp. DA3122]|uniref:carbonate dehydratase n=1 Tax=unclassified Halalkalibaculum TaxID=2964617 RepID=UPI003754275F